MTSNSDRRETGTGFGLVDLATIVTVAGILAAAAMVWRAGPEGPLPMHFNAAGQVDRWGDRSEMAIVIATMGVVACAISIFCAVMERQVRDPAADRFTYRLGRIIGLAALALVALLMTAMTFGKLGDGGAGDGPFLRMLLGGMALLFLGMGAFLGRAKPNPVVGVRTYWSLRSRLAWDKSNRLAGRLFSVIGVVGLLATPFAPLPWGFHGLVIAVIAAGLASVVESWRVWRSDPERA